MAGKARNVIKGAIKVLQVSFQPHLPYFLTSLTCPYSPLLALLMHLLPLRRRLQCD
jgi:hypothetical protein